MRADGDERVQNIFLSRDASKRELCLRIRAMHTAVRYPSVP
jgi:hypothetical protein